MATCIALVALAVWTVVRFRFEALAPDDAEYLFVGHTVLDGHLPQASTGGFYDVRSPVYPVFLAFGDVLFHNQSFLGAHLVAWVLCVAALVVSVWVSHRISSWPGAIGTGVALAVTPVIWMTVPGMRIDLPLVACAVVTIWLILEPRSWRWALAGAFLGLTVLLKETAGLLVFLPFAWLGAIPRPRWLRLTGWYTGVAFVVAAWWWVLVWVQERKLFPASGVEAVANRNVPRPFDLQPTALALIAVLAIGWGLFVVHFRRDPRARTVMVAGAALLPPAAYAWERELAIRQFVPIVVISCIAAGAALGSVAAGWMRRRGALLGAFAIVCAIALVAIVASQARIHPPRRSPGLSLPTSDWLRENMQAGDVVAMTFRDRSETALRLFDEAQVVDLPFEVDRELPELDEFLWLHEFGGKLFGLDRRMMTARLTDPDTRWLVMTGPHHSRAARITDQLGQNTVPGITRAAEFRDGNYYAVIYTIDPSIVPDGLLPIPAQVTAEAALEWLDRAATRTSEEAAIERLVAANLEVRGSGPARSVLADRIGPRAATSLGLTAFIDPR